MLSTRLEQLFKANQSGRWRATDSAICVAIDSSSINLSVDSGSEGDATLFNDFSTRSAAVMNFFECLFISSGASCRSQEQKKVIPEVEETQSEE